MSLGGRRGESELQFLLCGRLQLSLQRDICHSLKPWDSEKGLSCLSGVFLLEGGRINWGSIRVVKEFSLIKLKHTEQGGISSQKLGKAQLI